VVAALGKHLALARKVPRPQATDLQAADSELEEAGVAAESLPAEVEAAVAPVGPVRPPEQEPLRSRRQYEPRPN
jgi:hypothetical protein